MSFVISAIYRNSQLFMAADTKMSSASGTRTYNDGHKILRVSDRAYVGIAGMYVPGFRIAAEYQSIYESTWSFKQAVEELASTILAINERYSENARSDIDCAIMLGYQEQETPRIALLTLAKGTVQVFQEPLTAGDYQYFFANPNDYPFEKCLQLCQIRFRLAGGTPPVTVLNNLVSAVAAQSKFVNDNPECWLVCHGKQTYVPPINEFLDQFRI